MLSLVKNGLLTGDGMVLQNKIWEEAANRAFELTQKRKQLEAEEKEAYALLKQLSGDVDSQYGRWQYVCTMRKGNVDYSAIPELKSVNLDDYRKDPVAVWQLKPAWTKEFAWTDELTQFLANCNEGERLFLMNAIENSSHKADSSVFRKFIDDKLDAYNMLKSKGYKL